MKDDVPLVRFRDVFEIRKKNGKLIKSKQQLKPIRRKIEKRKRTDKPTCVVATNPVQEEKEKIVQDLQSFVCALKAWAQHIKRVIDNSETHKLLLRESRVAPNDLQLPLQNPETASLNVSTSGDDLSEDYSSLFLDTPLRIYTGEEEKLFDLEHDDDYKSYETEKVPEKLAEIFKPSDCNICWLDLYDGQSLYTLESCNHCFHLNCLSRCIGSRSIQKKCVKCFKEISKAECYKINQALIAETRYARAQKRAARSGK